MSSEVVSDPFSDWSTYFSRPIRDQIDISRPMRELVTTIVQDVERDFSQACASACAEWTQRPPGDQVKVEPQENAWNICHRNFPKRRLYR